MNLYEGAERNRADLIELHEYEIRALGGAKEYVYAPSREWAERLYEKLCPITSRADKRIVEIPSTYDIRHFYEGTGQDWIIEAATSRTIRNFGLEGRQGIEPEINRGGLKRGILINPDTRMVDSLAEEWNEERINQMVGGSATVLATSVIRGVENRIYGNKEQQTEYRKIAAVFLGKVKREFMKGTVLVLGNEGGKPSNPTMTHEEIEKSAIYGVFSDRGLSISNEKERSRYEKVMRAEAIKAMEGGRYER